MVRQIPYRVHPGSIHTYLTDFCGSSRSNNTVNVTYNYNGSIWGGGFGFCGFGGGSFGGGLGAGLGWGIGNLLGGMLGNFCMPQMSMPWMNGGGTPSLMSWWNGAGNKSNNTTITRDITTSSKNKDVKRLDKYAKKVAKAIENNDEKKAKELYIKLSGLTFKDEVNNDYDENRRKDLLKQLTKTFPQLENLSTPPIESEEHPETPEHVADSQEPPAENGGNGSGNNNQVQAPGSSGSQVVLPEQSATQVPQTEEFDPNKITSASEITPQILAAMNPQQAGDVIRNLFTKKSYSYKNLQGQSITNEAYIVGTEISNQNILNLFNKAQLPLAVATNTRCKEDRWIVGKVSDVTINDNKELESFTIDCDGYGRFNNKHTFTKKNNTYEKTVTCSKTSTSYTKETYTYDETEQLLVRQGQDAETQRKKQK